MPSQTAIAETFFDVERLLWKIVNDFHYEYKGDKEELMAQARAAFMRAYHSHDENKGPFIPWVKKRVTGLLLNQKIKEARRHRIMPASILDFDRVAEEPKWALDSFLNELSDDAAIVVGLVVAPPVPLADELKRCTAGWKLPRNARLVIRETLYGMGWTAERVIESFEEIRRALR